MSTSSCGKRLLRPTSLIFRLFLFCLVAVVPVLRAQSDEEFDSYKLKLEGFWVYASPSGSLQSSVQTGMGPIDLQKDLGFNNYSTFMGKLDWKFTHKNHLDIAGEAFKSSRQTVLTRTITFQGQTFEAGLTTQSNLDAPAYVVGYQYDIIRRRVAILDSELSSICLMLQLRSVPPLRSLPTVFITLRFRLPHPC